MVRLRRVLLSRAWLFALSFGLFAYVFHKVGAAAGYYPRYWWFQVLAHYLSATAMALLVARVALELDATGARLVAIVVFFSAVGALGWEVGEYLKLFPGLHWWGIEDSLLDLAVDAVGVLTVLSLLGTRIRKVIDPGEETTLGETVRVASDE